MYQPSKAVKNLERGKMQIGDSSRFLFGWLVHSKGDLDTMITDKGNVVQGRVTRK